MNKSAPIRLGLAGLGGYAGYLCDRFLEVARKEQPAIELVAVCEPALERFGARVRDLNSHGVNTYRTFEQLLAADIEAVWLPLPIDLHRPFTETALAAGKAVMCEKPAAGCVDDVDAMIAARDKAKLPVLIGFQDIYQPQVAALKKRLLAGEFGKPNSVTVIGCWPRSERYFGRNEWAGRLRRDGRWIMDSPASNALAHFINLSMFLLGDSFETSASSKSVAAELYRANEIESFDTCSLKIAIGDDVPLFVAYTHACASTIDPIITIETERATIRYIAGRHIEVNFSSQPKRDMELLPLVSHPHPQMFRAFQSCIRDTENASLCASLEIARQHVIALNVAAESFPIVDIPLEFLDARPGPDHATLRSIHDIIPAMEACTASKQMLHDTGMAPWSCHAAPVSIPPDYRHFRGPIASPRVSVTTHALHPRRPVPSVIR